MKRTSIAIVIFFMVFTIACKKSSGIPSTKSQGSNSGTTQSVPASSETSIASSVTSANPTMAPGSGIDQGMNPPHGQPSHRCDIAVGVPLDSPAGTGKSTPSNSKQPNMSPQTATPSTTPGMNPPHGQPNHRCDISVGAPLDSPPKAGKSTPTVVSQQIIPGQSNNTQPTPGANAPHGQPGHECDHGKPGHVCSPPSGVPGK
jgi:hypothetical protein